MKVLHWTVNEMRPKYRQNIGNGKRAHKQKMQQKQSFFVIQLNINKQWMENAVENATHINQLFTEYL